MNDLVKSMPGIEINEILSSIFYRLEQQDIQETERIKIQQQANVIIEGIKCETIKEMYQMKLKHIQEMFKINNNFKSFNEFMNKLDFKDSFNSQCFCDCYATFLDKIM